MEVVMHPEAASPPPVPTRRELLKAGINIVVAVPLERTIPSEAFPHFWGIARAGWPLAVRAYERTDVARNQFGKALLSEAALAEYTHICMLDIDQLHPGDTVERLARWVLQDQARQVVSGFHFRRGEPFDPLVMHYGSDGMAHPVAEWPRDTLMQAHVVGHGSILIAREVFQSISAPWWAYTYGGADGFTFPSEDMYFCRRCFEASIPIWVDTELSAPHLISSQVTEETFRLYLADHPEIIRTPDEVFAEAAGD